MGSTTTDASTPMVQAVKLSDLDIDHGTELGFGTYSQVYLAKLKNGEGSSSSGMYAVKVAEKCDKASNESLEKEWEVLRRLQGMPGVVQAYDFVREESQSYLVLEYMQGGELFERIIERERYTEIEARECAQNLLSIVRNLHAKNVVHRDIKPENLLCIAAESDQIKLADFGSAMILNDADAPIEEAAGTELYLAPEVIHFLYRPKEAPMCYGVGSDMWSCGVVIYVLLAGYPPFANDEGKVDQAVVDDIIHARFDFDDEVWDDVSSEAKSLVSSLLQVSPKKRLSATAALNHSW
eukprot:CAMPEP_0197291302 /NCGR_PEP_ID=MMETSP0890-20130614/12808_1 /TAXON_ID=44058 ORGANISM="Aureoumbra lagunensis, Strain CCMP1510" /NCGR_SAMPLE_ID=MMETSP0890 /ASSEMBLY_ACC=CAM_ASM_000533 /LENGTH=294 /DNA_ID=CAMNT_0042764059 /DNA_START=46 /DNA_END=927 /DNA_ORIENTATION=+